MGIVYRQSVSNVIITYLGFGIGAINTLFLYTRFLTDEYYGLVGVILSTAAILMPLLAFGVPNTLIKFYSSFKSPQDTDGFLTLMLLLPVFLIIPVGFISYFANDVIGQFLAAKNKIVQDYVWYIFLIGMAMAYFEVLYSWAKIQMKSVFGNFMKEVFVRVGVTVLLIMVYYDVISVEIFLKALVGLYIVRMLIMKFYAYNLKMPSLKLNLPNNLRDILIYGLLIILGGSASVILLEIDRFMINQFIAIENVAYYSVAVFIATVISVPSRAMHQITYPLTAQILNAKDTLALATLYQRTSLTLFIVSGLIFILIILNLEDLYLMIPMAYRGGFTVVLLIGLAKVYDATLGNNNAILYNSDYYKTVLLLGVLLAIMTIIFNLLFIPRFGLNGAALATFISILIYNTLKLVYVKQKFAISPFSKATLKVIVLLLAISLLFYFIRFNFHPIFNILLKSILISVIYLLMVYRLKISKDVSDVISKFW